MQYETVDFQTLIIVWFIIYIYFFKYSNTVYKNIYLLSVKTFFDYLIVSWEWEFTAQQLWHSFNNFGGNGEYFSVWQLSAISKHLI